jgi:GTPase SAR1 family protein
LWLSAKALSERHAFALHLRVKNTQQHIHPRVRSGHTASRAISFFSRQKNNFDNFLSPLVFDNYSALYKSSKAGSTAIVLGLWEVLQREDSARLRPLSYPQTDCFILSFSVDNAASFEALFTVWIPEVTYHCPKAIFVVVGMKSDLRNDPTHVRRHIEETGV